jgi:hypothetical protein
VLMVLGATVLKLLGAGVLKVLWVSAPVAPALLAPTRTFSTSSTVLGECGGAKPSRVK